MLMTQCSERLLKYLRTIESLTGRQIEIQELPAEELYKMKSAFIHHPTCIKIIIAAGSDPTDPEIEQSIAHEATHGLLVYKLKCCIGVFKNDPDEKQKKLVTLVFTMISDIIVNTLIQKEGFLPYSPRYPEMVRQEFVAMQKGAILYDDLIDDPPYRNKHMVFRYILAWGFLKYIDLDKDVRKILVNFTNEFQLKNLEQYTMAMKVQQLILLNDIFTTKGYWKVISELLVLWGLGDIVDLRTV